MLRRILDNSVLCQYWHQRSAQARRAGQTIGPDLARQWLASRLRCDVVTLDKGFPRHGA
jgi:hypothetical protein